MAANPIYCDRLRYRGSWVLIRKQSIYWSELVMQMASLCHYLQLNQTNTNRSLTVEVSYRASCWDMGLFLNWGIHHNHKVILQQERTHTHTYEQSINQLSFKLCGFKVIVVTKVSLDWTMKCVPFLPVPIIKYRLSGDGVFSASDDNGGSDFTGWSLKSIDRMQTSGLGSSVKLYGYSVSFPLSLSLSPILCLFQLVAVAVSYAIFYFSWRIQPGARVRPAGPNRHAKRTQHEAI